MTREQWKQEVIDRLLELSDSIISEVAKIEEDGINYVSYENICGISDRLIDCSLEIKNIWYCDISTYEQLVSKAMRPGVTKEDRLNLYNWLECNARHRMNDVSEFHIQNNIWLCPVFEGEGPDEEGWYKNYKLVDAVFEIR